MELFGSQSGSPAAGPPSAIGPLYWSLVLISLMAVAIVVPMAPTKVGIAVVAAWILLIWIAISFVLGRFHYFTLMWVAVYPYCYYLFAYPRARAVFTVDRAFIVLIAVEMLVVSRQAVVPILTTDLRVSAYFLSLYLLVCFISLAGHPLSEVLPPYRSLVDGMVLPAVFGLYAIRYFPLLKNLQKLHLCTCILGLGLCVTGLIELRTGVDLFPLSGANPDFLDTHVLRPDGPFDQQVVLSVVATLAFFLIVYLRRLMPPKISPYRAVLHKAGAVASLGAAFLPLNRGLVLAFLPIAIIDSRSSHRLLSRRIWAAFFGLILLAAFAAKLLDPQLFEDRVANPANFYQRVAQQRETLQVVREYPFFGVGFGLYQDIATKNPRYMTRWKGIDSMNVPHNVLMTVLSEEGLIGLSFYVAAQIFFVRAMWKIRKVYPPGWLAFLYCLLVYTLIGMDFAIGSLSDINLFYILTLGIILQLQTRIAREQERALLTPMRALSE
jgi:hypothetical protein